MEGQEHMDSGKEFHFHIQLTTKDLWAFSMYHSNRGGMGLFNVFFTVASVWALLARWNDLTVPYRLLFVVCAMMFTVLQPVMLYWKASRQARTKAIREPMEMIFRKEGFTIIQGEAKADQVWDNVRKADKVGKLLILYMDRIHAYLLTERAMGEDREGFFAMVRELLPKSRRKRV